MVIICGREVARLGIGRSQAPGSPDKQSDQSRVEPGYSSGLTQDRALSQALLSLIDQSLVVGHPEGKGNVTLMELAFFS